MNDVSPTFPDGARRIGLWAVLMLAPLMGACSSGDTRLVVSAASSLTDAFSEIEVAFEAAHPGVDVVLNLGGSSTLRDQILDGAPADVFAAADVETMEGVEERAATTPTVFATNQLQLATPAGNPTEITDLGDLAREDLLIGLCADQVPCGRLTRITLESAGIEAAPDTLEPNVRSLAAKLVEGEIDVAMLYVTDTSNEPAIDVVGPPIGPPNEYPIAVLRETSHPEIAAEFVAFVLSTEGQSILSDLGFGLP